MPVYVSLADGGRYRLTPDATTCQPVATVSPRIVHRMVLPGSDGVILLGGAHRRDNLDRVERIPLR